MASAAVEIKEGAGAYQPSTNGFDATPGALVTIHLIDASGVIANGWSVVCLTTDDSSDANLVNAALSVDAGVAKTATFTAPAAGKAYRLESTVILANGQTLKSTFCVYTLIGPSSLRVGAKGETIEGDEVFAWATKANAAIRAIAGGGGSTPTGTGFVHITSGTQDGAAKLVANADVASNAAIDYTKFGAGAQTIQASSFASDTDANGHRLDTNPASVTTTDDTPTVAWAIDALPDSVVVATVAVAAKNADGTVAGTWVGVTACFAVDGVGAFTPIGSPASGTAFKNAGGATLDVAWNSDGEVEVTGIAATNLVWTVIGQQLQVV